MRIRKLNFKFILGIIYIIVATVILSFSINNYQNDDIVKADGTTHKPTTTQEQTTQPTTQVTTAQVVRTVRLECNSVQNDLKIKLLDEQSKQYITGVPFSATVTDKSGKQSSYTGKDLKGYIYINKVRAGVYTVKLNVPEGFVASVDTASVTVKDKVDYKVINDIKDKVSPSQNVKEDTKVPQDIVQEVVLKDTVEFVQSSTTKIPGVIKYVTVEFDKVKAPETSESTTGATGESTTNTSSTTSTTATSTTKNDILYDANGNKLYIKVNDKYVLATSKDYNSANQFYKQEIVPDSYKYTGWQTIDKKTYYYDKNGSYVTGNQIINGAKYSFSNEGVLAPGFGVLGIDVSKYQGNIDWKAVKSSGVQFAIVRAGFRGYGSGVLVEDAKFKSNMKGALAAGLDVGIYYFSQAINEVEAVEEASLCVQLAKAYKVKYPIFIDTETSGGNGSGRADTLTTQQRTAVCRAFCETVQSKGYKTGIYTSKSWFEKKLDMTQLGQYLVWLAQWTSTPTYKGKYDVWQYTSKGQVAGISGNVDMNLSYMTF
ncbi:MAG: GH25 family lysozyme [Oscillospiraceae bacterium]